MNHAIFLLYPDWGTLLHLHFYVNIKFTTPEASGGFVSDLTLICFSKKATETQDAVFLVLSVSGIHHIRSTHPEGVLNVNQRGSMRIILIRFGVQSTIEAAWQLVETGMVPWVAVLIGNIPFAQNVTDAS